MNTNKLRIYYSWLFILFAIFLVVCLLINSLYCLPEADLYVSADLYKQLGLLGAQKYWYFHWSGRLMPNLVLCFGEFFIRNLWAYQLFSAMVIVSFYGTILKLITRFFVFENKLDLYFSWAIISLTITQISASIPSSFYWMPSSVTYTVPVIVSVWSVIFIFNRNLLLQIIGFILLLILSTFNEIVDLLLIEFFIYLIVFNFKDKKFSNKLILALFIFLIGTIVLFTAPGNFERKVFMRDELNLIEIIFSSNKELFQNLYKWLLGSPILLLLLLLFLIRNTAIQFNEKVKAIIFKRNALFYLFLYCIFLTPYFLIYKLTSEKPEGRIINIVNCVFVVTVFFLISKWFIKHSLDEKFLNNPIIKYITVISILIVLFEFNDFSKNISLIITDATSGKSQAYYKDYTKQLKDLELSKGDTAFVSRINTIAPTISINVMGDDTSNWVYSQFCGYYKKKKIIVK